jgi:hypothetical protein
MAYDIHEDIKYQGFEVVEAVVPHGVVHRTRAPTRTVVLMVEAASVKPIGD